MTRGAGMTLLRPKGQGFRLRINYGGQDGGQNSGLNKSPATGAGAKHCAAVPAAAKQTRRKTAGKLRRTSWRGKPHPTKMDSRFHGNDKGRCRPPLRALRRINAGNG